MIIDGHAHLGGEYRDLPAVIDTLDRAGADKVVLCPAEKDRPVSMPIPPLAGKVPYHELSYGVNRLLRTATGNRKTAEYIDHGNEEVSRIAAASGGRVIQFYWADIRRKDLIDDLDFKLNSWSFRGIKLHQSCQPFRIRSDRFRELAEYAFSKDLPVFIHLHSKSEVSDFIAESAVLKTVFITGHLIGLEIFTGNRHKVGENVFFDISCPQLVSLGMIKNVLKVFGRERIILGSDTPYGRNNLNLVISHVGKLGLSERETAMILGENLRNILKL